MIAIMVVSCLVVGIACVFLVMGGSRLYWKWKVAFIAMWLSGSIAALEAAKGQTESKYWFGLMMAVCIITAIAFVVEAIEN